MDKQSARVTTGLVGLDDILDGLRIGDNVVWAIDSFDDYKFFIDPFLQAAKREGRRIVYFRFGEHPPLVGDDPRIIRYDLNAHHGFESFTTSVHHRITEHGVGTFYLFDCLSDLLSAWATDQMIGHFFQVTCPYLFRMDTIAYFAVMRAHHSFHTIARIRQTTQVMVAVYAREQVLHAHPIKVWQRHSPTMFLPHRMQGHRFVPIANSLDATNLLSDVRRSSIDSPRRRLDYWDRLFMQAEEIAGTPCDHPRHQAMIDTLCRVMISQDERILELARRNLTLTDLLAIKSRLIGTGFIGGKAVGMWIARKILESSGDFDWKAKLEPHDSFYVGSDVYYSFIVHNQWWELLMKQKQEAWYFDVAAELEAKMRDGDLPGDVLDALRQMLEYFGQYPLVVRSSSLLEDGFGGAFAGKYESCFCVNQGSPEERLEQFVDAMRRIFASTMSRDALSYRKQRGLEHREEPMGLLVQRVSGRYHGHYYMPDLAGVGVSYNTFVWSKDMDPRAGMLRLVMGMGTRAVDRVENDYPCTIALDQPMRRPYGGSEGARRYCQRDVDLLDVDSNQLKSISLMDLLSEGVAMQLDRFGVPDREIEQRMRDRGAAGGASWLLTFEPLLSKTGFAKMMQQLMKTIESAYAYPVDIEFTVNFNERGEERINLVQCRPLQTHGAEQNVQFPRQIASERMFFRTQGNFMGGSVQLRIDRVIWVDPQGYMRSMIDQRQQIARIVGQLNRISGGDTGVVTLLLGPGRWGTSTPSLGVPVRFSEINNIAALVEVASQEAGIVPELSYGTHFFQDLVESGTFYAALSIDQDNCELQMDYLNRFENVLASLLPEHAGFAPIIRVYDVKGSGLTLFSDVVRQEAICGVP